MGGIYVFGKERKREREPNIERKWKHSREREFMKQRKNDSLCNIESKVEPFFTLVLFCVTINSILSSFPFSFLFFYSTWFNNLWLSSSNYAGFTQKCNLAEKKSYSDLQARYIFNSFNGKSQWSISWTFHMTSDSSKMIIPHLSFFLSFTLDSLSFTLDFFLAQMSTIDVSKSKNGTKNYGLETRERERERAETSKFWKNEKKTEHKKGFEVGGFEILIKNSSGNAFSRLKQHNISKCWKVIFSSSLSLTLFSLSLRA